MDGKVLGVKGSASQVIEGGLNVEGSVVGKDLGLGAKVGQVVGVDAQLGAA